jgi:hypothetical protein
MDRAMGDERERERCAAGLARARSFSWERSTRETLQVYEEALERKDAAPEAPAVPLESELREARAVVDTIAYGRSSNIR